MKEFKFVAVDSEGDVGKTGLLGCSHYSDGSFGYLTAHNEIRVMLQSYAADGFTFLCHNASYDIPVLFWQLDLDVKMIHYNGRFNHGAWKYDRRKPQAYIWDTGVLSGIRKLATLGAGIGLPKWDTPQALLGKDPDKYQWTCARHGRGECIECYAVRDAEIPFVFMTEFHDLLTGWGIAPKATLSAIAMDVWRSFDSPRPIGLSDRKIEHLARAAYYGGRTELYKVGHIPDIYAADISSAYPAAMRSTPYPDPDCMVYTTHVSPDRVQWWREGAAEVDVSIPYMHSPPLPYTYKGERLYPCGRIVGCWTLLEIRHALALGCRINAVHRLAFATSNLDPFERYVDILWALRNGWKDRQDPRQLLAKLLLNNLYGRLGMGDSIERRIIGRVTNRTTMGQWDGAIPVDIGGNLYLDKSDDMYFENKWRNVLWAAQTTSAVRVALHRYMLDVGDALIYTDTDSIYSTAPIATGTDELGSLRPDGTYTAGLFVAPKLYAVQSRPADMPDSWQHEQCVPHHIRMCDECRWKATAKGVPSGVAKAFLREGSVSFARPIKPIEQARSGVQAGTWIDVSRSQHPRPYRRPLRNPELIHDEYGASGTSSPVVGPLP